MAKIYGYIRGSLAKQVITIQAQREKIEQYAKLYQLDITDAIEDEATTSKIPFIDRPGGGRIHAAIQKRHVSTIIVAKLDRAFRSTVECLRTVTEWNKRGVNLHVIDFRGIAINTQSSTGKLMLTFFAAIAEWERDVIAERTREAHLSAQRNGKLITRPDQPPYGTQVKTILCAACQSQKETPRRKHRAAASAATAYARGSASPCPDCKGRGWIRILIGNPEEQKIIEIICALRQGAGDNPDGDQNQNQNQKKLGGTRIANLLNPSFATGG